MSTSLAADQVAPSYGEYQDPLVAAQLELWTTFVPSRANMTSRVLHVLSSFRYQSVGKLCCFNSPALGDPVRKQSPAVPVL